MVRAGAAAAAIAVLVLIAHTALGNSSELGRALSVAAHPSAGWLALAAVCELVSYVAYASAQRGLVRAAGHRLNLRWLASLAVAAQAVNNFLPAGALAANLFNFRQLRRAEVPAPASGWILLMTSVLNIAALAGLALIGSELTGEDGGALAAVHDVSLALLAGAAAAALLASPRVRALRPCRCVAPGLARAGHALLARHRGAGTIARRARESLTQLAHVKLSRRGVATAGGLLALCWLADACCLVSAFLAIGTRPPWSVLLLAYCGAQLVSYLPLTPGGLGLVEGSLALALTAGGVGVGHVLAAVLLYRMMSYWATLPLGGFGYLSLRRGGFRVRERGSLGWRWPSPSSPIYAPRSSTSP